MLGFPILRRIYTLLAGRIGLRLPVSKKEEERGEENTLLYLFLFRYYVLCTEICVLDRALKRKLYKKIAFPYESITIYSLKSVNQ